MYYHYVNICSMHNVSCTAWIFSFLILLLLLLFSSSFFPNSLSFSLSLSFSHSFSNSCVFGATVCYACKTTSLLREPEHGLRVRAMKSLCALCVCVLIVHSTVSMLLLKCSWKFSAWFFNSFVYVFYRLRANEKCFNFFLT